MDQSTLRCLLEDLQSGGFSAKQALEIRHVSSGSINSTFLVKTEGGNFFAKVNDAKKFPEMFQKEARGLALLRKTQTLRIPKEICLSECENDRALLALEFIIEGRKGNNFWENFGRGLAKLHKNSSSEFGLEYSNYIGSLVQENDFEKSWAEFFALRRIEPQLRFARNTTQFQARDLQNFENLLGKISDLVPEEEPALLHGDLWSGNFMSDEAGNPAIFDPAIYFGHREMDLAMSQLFGGFAADFYRFYNKEFPLENGWEERMDLHNLYPLLVHVNLFGGGYVSQVRSVLKKFV